MAAGAFTNVGKDIGLYIESLVDVVMNSTKKVPTRLPFLFDMKTTDHIQTDRLSMSGIGPFLPWTGTGDPIERQSIDQRYKTTLYQAFWALATNYHYLDKKFVKYHVLADQAEQLGLQQANTKELLGTSWHAQQIAHTGSYWNDTEAKYLFDTAHPLVGGPVSTYGNLIHLPMGPTAIQTAYTLLKQTPDDQGMLMNFTAKRLLVAPDIEFAAYEAYGKYSTYKAGSANLTENAFKESKVDSLTIEVIPQWPDGYWELVGDRDGCLWETSVDLDQEQYEDKPTKDTIHQAIFGVAYGARDWRGRVASDGAGA